MYSKSAKFIFSLFIVGFFLFCAYVVYQFVLYENYSSGRWDMRVCGLSGEECKFGEVCDYDYNTCSDGMDCTLEFMPPRCVPQMNDLMELVFGEE
ncbi:MAG: hypothetical protein WCY37_02920 [Candidatus Dojkabacteria bacterium]